MSRSRKGTSRPRRKRSLGKRIACWVGSIVVGFVLFSLAQVLVLRYIPVYYTPIMLRRQIEHHGTAYDLQHRWVALDAISPQLVRAVIASEDNLFQTHNGFSEEGIRNAIREKKEQGHIRHGGSTISQQTAKNLFTFGSRTYARKGIEAYYTFLIEHLWGKRRIMEVYLNSAEMGNGIFGAEAAAEVYFQHPARHIDTKEAALLAACLPNPNRLHAGSPSAYVRQRQQQILLLMPKMGKIEL